MYVLMEWRESHVPGKDSDVDREERLIQLDGEADPKLHVVDYASQPGGTLLPMLISGIVLIVICMIAVMIYF
jgi:hypothetical protein